MNVRKDNLPIPGDVFQYGGAWLRCEPMSFDCEYCYFLHDPVGCQLSPPCTSQSRPDHKAVVFGTAPLSSPFSKNEKQFV